MSTATKTDPEKWEQAKRDAKARMGGKHSARAMQLATQLYKKRGGGYSGAKPTAKSNSLKKWTKQKWKWSGGSKDKGVYLPSDKVERLKSSKEGKKKLRAAGRKKSKATREGRQYSSHGLAAGTSLKKEAAINAETFKRFGRTLAAKLSKLPADEKAALIAGTLSPMPGGSVVVPAAYKGSKKATKTFLAAIMKAHLELAAPGLRAAAKRSNIVRGAKAVSTSTKTAAAPTAATIPAANNTRSSIMRVAPLNRKPMAAVAAPTNLFKVPPQMLRDVTSMPKVKRPSLQMIGEKLKAKASLGPIAGSMAFKGGKLKSVGIGLKGSLASNIKGNFGVKLPVGGKQKPYFSGGISGRF